jgi:hypothetical protein
VLDRYSNLNSSGGKIALGRFTVNVVEISDIPLSFALKKLSRGNVLAVILAVPTAGVGGGFVGEISLDILDFVGTLGLSARCDAKPRCSDEVGSRVSVVLATTKGRDPLGVKCGRSEHDFSKGGVAIGPPCETVVLSRGNFKADIHIPVFLVLEHPQT